MTDKDKARLYFARNSVHKVGKIVIEGSHDIDEAACIGSDGFGWTRAENGKLVKVRHSGGVKIGRDVEIRAFVTVDRATREGNFTEIGDGTKIDHHTHVAHNCKIGKNNTFANGCSIEGSCQVGDCNTFGSIVVMQRKTKIGNNNLIGSGAVITKDFGDNLVIVGNPARVLKENI